MKYSGEKELWKNWFEKGRRIGGQVKGYRGYERLLQDVMQWGNNPHPFFSQNLDSANSEIENQWKRLIPEWQLLAYSFFSLLVQFSHWNECWCQNPDVRNPFLLYDISRKEQWKQQFLQNGNTASNLGLKCNTSFHNTLAKAKATFAGFKMDGWLWGSIKKWKKHRHPVLHACVNFRSEESPPQKMCRLYSQSSRLELFTLYCNRLISHSFFKPSLWWAKHED